MVHAYLLAKTIHIDQQSRLEGHPMPERIEDAMRQYFDDEHEDRRLTISHRRILQEVQRTPRLGILDLAIRLEISPSAGKALIEELVSLGYLNISRCSDERFDGAMVLTDHGRTLFSSPRTKALSWQFCRGG
jgi:DNA-binding MarR family transcriptional regulator